MSEEAWLTWSIAPSGSDANNSNTFCIIKDPEFDTEIEGGLSNCSTEETMQEGQWQMVQMSQVTREPSNHVLIPASPTTERFLCHLCHKSFSSRAYLHQHIRLHSGEKPHVCDECGMAFAQKCNLKMHRRIHTGERPFMCGICGKTFSRSSHLKGHMLRHTGDKPYSCDTCGQQFTNSQGKKNHMRLHLGERPFQCEICNATYAHKESLKIHVKSHRRESRYYCSICKRKFVLRSALYEHMTFHSKNKMFECDQCNKRFKQKYYLKKHKSTICCNRPLLPEIKVENGVKEPTQLKYRVLTANEKALPQYSDSDEEDDVHEQLSVQQDSDEEFLDGAFVRVLRRTGYKI
ncbi:zinc finger protein 501-like [Hyalella azteca]|uniref:Zinc finger protein 501-like n=1 Tax=Hyalella azteca TaxID=294128 RepID=A0A8B7N155_HYAAZ|nr:zinc finger protein 501-like [Hyalella azteca]